MVGPSVTVGEFSDPDRARIIEIVDLKNDIREIFNWEPVANPNPDPTIPDLIWVPTLETDGAPDEGLRHTFRVDEDQFAEGDRRLINHKKYYFSVVAYAHNNFADFVQIGDRIEGQRTSYIEGRRNIQTYTVTPRPIVDETLNAEYGDGPIITRLDGQGAGAVSYTHLTLPTKA